MPEQTHPPMQASRDHLPALLHCALRQAIDSTPSQPAPYLHLGLYAIEHGAYEEAIAALEDALELNPYMPEAYVALIDLLLEVGDESRAAGYYGQALDLLRVPAPLRARFGARLDPTRVAVVPGAYFVLDSVGAWTDVLETFLGAFGPHAPISLVLLTSDANLPRVESVILALLERLGLDPEGIPDLVVQPVATEPARRDLLLGARAFLLAADGTEEGLGTMAREVGCPVLPAPAADGLRLAAGSPAKSERS